MVRRHDVARRVLALAVEIERLVEPRQQIGMTPAHLLVGGGEAHDAAHPAFHRRAQAQQADIVRRHVVIAVVGMEVLLGVGDVGAHAVAGRAAEIADVVDRRAVPFLRHRPRDQGGQKPPHGPRAARRPAFDGQAIDDGEARPVVEAPLDLAHEGARGVEREILRAQQQERQRVAIERGDDAVEFRLDRGGKREAAGTGGQIVAAPQQALRQRRGEICNGAWLSRARAR